MANKYRTPEGNLVVVEEPVEDYILVGPAKERPNPAGELVKNDNWSQQDRDNALRLILEKLG